MKVLNSVGPYSVRKSKSGAVYYYNTVENKRAKQSDYSKYIKLLRSNADKKWRHRGKFISNYDKALLKEYLERKFAPQINEGKLNLADLKEKVNSWDQGSYKRAIETAKGLPLQTIILWIKNMESKQRMSFESIFDAFRRQRAKFFFFGRELSPALFHLKVVQMATAAENFALEQVDKVYSVGGDFDLDYKNNAMYFDGRMEVVPLATIMYNTQKEQFQIIEKYG